MNQSLRAGHTALALILYLSISLVTETRADIVVTIDTSQFISNGQTGFVDIAFSANTNLSETVTATVAPFTTDGSVINDTTNDSVIGGVTVTPGTDPPFSPGETEIFTNTSYGEVFQAFHFGTYFSFDLNLAIQPPSTPTDESFLYVSLYDSDQNIVPTTDPTLLNTVATVTFDPTQGTSVQTFGPASVPEPSSLVMGCLGVAIAGVSRFARRARAVPAGRG